MKKLSVIIVALVSMFCVANAANGDHRRHGWSNHNYQPRHYGYSVRHCNSTPRFVYAPTVRYTYQNNDCGPRYYQPRYEYQRYSEYRTNPVVSVRYNFYGGGRWCNRTTQYRHGSSNRHFRTCR